MNTKYQIAWLRGLGGDTDGTAASIADKLESLSSESRALRDLLIIEGYDDRGIDLALEIESILVSIEQSTTTTTKMCGYCGKEIWPFLVCACDDPVSTGRESGRQKHE